MVDGGQGDVLIATAVAGDEVPIEEFVVVGPRNRRRSRSSGIEIIDDAVAVRRHEHAGLAVHRVGAMRDVVEEGVAGAEGG